jgi:hypothetical protein
MIALTPRLVLPIAIAVAVAALAGSIYLRGRSDQVAATAEQDREASDAADGARVRVRACYDTGGLWDQRTGLCRR